MDGSDMIASRIYIRREILSVRTNSFITGKSISKDMEHIKERISDFGAFKEEGKGIEITCNTIQTSISLWKEYFETTIENNECFCASESNSYYWLISDGIKSIISMNPYEHLLSEKSRIENKSQILIDNKQKLCEHGGLHPMTLQKGKYIPVNVYISMKDTFIKNWQSRSVLGFNSSEGITNTTSHDISDINMRCEVCINELWDDMSRKFDILKELHSLVKALNKSYKVPREEKYGVCKNS